ncbi:MAG: HlyD family efflux transporter periplasmic adaptor subunit [Acidobacteriota bacterium]
MDIQREDRSQEKKRRRILLVTGGVVLLALITLGLARMKPAAPTVERASLYIDTVRRGPMTREVRGPGSLVSVDVRWIAAATEGRVERQILQPGSQVKADSVILELASPEVEQAAIEAEAQVRAGEADLANLKAQLVSETLTQQAQAAAVEADFNQAKLQSEADTELNKEGLVSKLTQRLSALRADQLSKRNDIEKERLSKRSDAVDAQLRAQGARVDQLRALYQLRRGQLESLHVRAGIDGVLQQVPVAVGQRVGLGTNLARVARPGELKAELRIAETQAKDLTIGQKAAIDTRNGIVEGTVSRIDPGAREGSVLVDVRLLGTLPSGARPDLNVDGTIELEHLDSVLFVGRPTYGNSGSTVGLFKLTANGKEAGRTAVQLGRSSVNTVEIVNGLAEGDQVILSDMSAWDAFDRVRVR